MKSNDGFTIAEMLVVLAVLALVFGISMPFLGGNAPPVPVEQSLQEITALLQSARLKAVQANRLVSIDMGVLKVRSASIDVVIEGKQGSVLFFPDGSSSGAKIAVQQDGQTGIIVVMGSTGSVVIQKDATK